MRSIPLAQPTDLRKKREEYLRFRRAPAEVSALLKKIPAVLDKIQKTARRGTMRGEGDPSTDGRRIPAL
jgi:hypothetical protein